MVTVADTVAGKICKILKGNQVCLVAFHRVYAQTDAQRACWAREAFQQSGQGIQPFAQPFSAFKKEIVVVSFASGSEFSGGFKEAIQEMIDLPQDVIALTASAKVVD